MPARERRTGFRTGELAADLRDRLDAELTRASNLDAAASVRAAGAILAGLDGYLAKAAEIRLAAIGQLRSDGASYDQIAADTGLSKSRVAQLAREAARRR